MSALDISVVVPVRNAEAILEECLRSIMQSDPRELIVVDGLSSDRTVEIARSYGARILSDEGRGLPAARLLGARASVSRRVALIDADVIVPEHGLARLLAEFEEGGYAGLQAGQLSVSGRGYWGRALVHHHRSGRSKNWFGLVATIFDRETLLEHGFDSRFLSGEDIELRWRLQQAGVRIGVSQQTIVSHRFGDSFDFARDQFLADGRGLGRMIRKHRRRGVGLLALPFAAGVRGVALSLVRLDVRWVPYFACFVAYNYLGMAREFTRAHAEERAA
jgi:glycosyltransferase involved in cell wall biosynthesis